MGKQVWFIAAEEDYQELLRLAEQLGCLAIPPMLPMDDVPDAVLPLHYRFQDSDGFFYLLPPRIAPVEAFYQRTSNDPKKSILMASVSPVIEIAPSLRNGDIVQASRIYLGLDQGDRFYKQVDSIYNMLAKHVRKWELIAEHRLYVGPKAAALARAGEIQLKYQILPVSLP
jgi:hypothetical protein